MLLFCCFRALFVCFFLIVVPERKSNKMNPKCQKVMHGEECEEVEEFIEEKRKMMGIIDALFSFPLFLVDLRYMLKVYEMMCVRDVGFSEPRVPFSLLRDIRYLETDTSTTDGQQRLKISQSHAHTRPNDSPDETQEML